jgi:DNA-binding MarR family transcriptional regulator
MAIKNTLIIQNAIFAFTRVEKKALERIGSGINVGANHFLACIQMYPGQRAREMAAAYKLTQHTIERWLKQFKEQDLIEFKGATKIVGCYSKECGNK